MVERTRILICGDIGPTRDALTPRKDVELLSADSVEGAIRLCRSATPAICLTRAKLEGGSVLDLLRELKASGTTSIVLIHLTELDLRAQCLAAGATELVELRRPDVVLDMIAEYTRLAFPRQPRAPYQALVHVLAEGEDRLLETVDLSASGVAIRGFPALQLGALACIIFVEEPKRPVLWARLIRAWNEDGVRMGGLKFVGLAESEWRWLQGLVRRFAKTVEQEEDLSEAVTADLRPLRALAPTLVPGAPQPGQSGAERIDTSREIRLVADGE